MPNQTLIRGGRPICLLTIAFLLAFVPAARADFIETTWHVVGFSGEAWYANTSEIIGHSQTFNGGFAKGPFFNCDFNGMSSTYTTYEADDFFSNPEFKLFGTEESGIRLGSDKVFVHRITCEGGGDPSRREVLYPFVTNSARKSAWYLFEGGIFSLFAP